MYSPTAPRSPDQLQEGYNRNSDIQIFIDPDADDKSQPGPTHPLLGKERMPLADRTAEFELSYIKRDIASLLDEIRREIAHARRARCILQYRRSNYKRLTQNYVRLLVQSGRAHNRAVQRLKSNGSRLNHGLGIYIPQQNQ